MSKMNHLSRILAQKATSTIFAPPPKNLLQQAFDSGNHYESCDEHESNKPNSASGLCRSARNAAPVNEVLDIDIVHEVLQAPGQPLDSATRAFMEPRFGYDFSGVRVHTDTKAAESAQVVNAQAYTVGRDVVFGAGEYAPTSQYGKQILSHELTHVVQQKGEKPPTTLKLSEPEHVTGHEAEHVASRGNLVRQTSSPGIVRRSLLGGILGGLGGAAGGALIGGLLGVPIGAVIGGAVGLIGGAIVGDAVSTKSRTLNNSEVDYARTVFHDSIDYLKIRITRDSMYSVGAPLTIANTIHLKSSWGHFEAETLDLTEQGLETLIDETAHVGQYQNGGLAYIPQSLLAQFGAFISGEDRGGAYDWRAAHRERKVWWGEWNPEQQASAIEDYNKLLHKSKDGTATVAEIAKLSILVGYMQYVWLREGAPTFKRPVMEDAPI